LQFVSGFARVAFRIAPVLVLFTSMSDANAQEFLSAPLIKQGDETLVISLGGIGNRFDSTLQLNGRAQEGTDLNLEKNGLQKSQWSFQAGLTWRFLSRNRIDVGYFSASRSGSRTYDKSITIGDNVYPNGATVSATVKDGFLIADYRYSFVKTDDLEFAGVVGVYGDRFKYDVSAIGNSAGVTRSSRTSASTTLPLPLIGASFDWYINPRWKLSGNVEGMKARIGDFDGHALVATALTDYTLFRNLGVGIRYIYSDVSVDVTRSDFSGNFSRRMNSVSLYSRLIF
jgi:hypothetical protein